MARKMLIDGELDKHNEGETHYDFDLFVIGAGSGGVRASRFSAQYGAKVGICELPFHPISSEVIGGVGGTCVIRGCVPKKILVYGASFGPELEDARNYGWELNERIDFNWKKLLHKKTEEIVRLNGIYKRLLANAGVKLFEGEGRVVGPNEVEVIQLDGTKISYSAKHILIATGSRAQRPDIPGQELAITSDEALSLEELPKRAVILGGGYIAVEFASIWRGMGATVDLCFRKELPLRGFDDELRAVVARNLEGRGINMHPRTTLTELVKTEDGIKVRTDHGEEITADVVLFATGRAPNTKRLNLESVGVELDNRTGAVKVDDYSRTNIPTIWALGDVTNRMNLTPVALMEGTCFAKTVFGGQPTAPDYNHIPCAVFCIPPLSVVGLSEELALEDANDDVLVFVSTFNPMKNTISGRQEKTVMKLVVDAETDKVLGASMCGPDAPEIMQDQDSGKMIGRAKEQNGLYYLETPSNSSVKMSMPPLSFFSERSLSNKEKNWLYHRRLGHPSFRTLNILFPSLSKGLAVEIFYCEVCELAKHKRVPFPISNKRSSVPFSLIHCDIWGPPIPNISGARWFVSFIDDCTRISWIFLLKNKSDVSFVLPNFHIMVQNQFGVKIKRFRSDNAREYFNQVLTPYFQKECIIHESSCISTPQQNGIAERKNGHLFDTTRAFLFQNKMPKSYWGEAVLTATYLINRLPSRVLDFKSPMEILSKFYPNLHTSNHLIPKIFGCVSYVHVHSSNREKLDQRAIRCVFVSYSPTQKGYKCYHPPSKKFYISVDVTFHEKESYFSTPYLQGENIVMEDKDSFLPDLPSSITPVLPTPSSSIPTLLTPTEFDDSIPKSLVEPDEPLHTIETMPTQLSPFVKVYSRKKALIPELALVRGSNSNPGNEVTSYSFPLQIELNHHSDSNSDLNVPIAIRKGTRECTKHPLYPLSHVVSFEKFSPTHRSFLTNLNNIHIPTSLSEALSNENWKQAMNVEMQALEKNKIWELVPLPAGKRPVGCKWVYTVKYKADGSLERYKARLVAKGYTQTYGVDYQETLAPVAKMNTVRILLSLAANYNWDLQQFDVKNAFLHGDLEEEIYMEIPPGFGRNIAANHVCKLKKALYGLKQSPRAWFRRFAKVMTEMGYRQSQWDHTLFVKHSNSGGVIALLVYADDIIITGNDKKERQVLKHYLAKEFEIKELGRLKYFLGIEVAHSKNGNFHLPTKVCYRSSQENRKVGM